MDASNWSHKNPFPARLLVNRRLSGAHSAKDTRHYELSLEGSGLTHESGDALGVVETNDPVLVQNILHALGCSGEESVPDKAGGTQPFRTALLHDYAINRAPKPFVLALAEKVPDAAPLLVSILTPGHEWEGMEVFDLLEEFPLARFTPEEFVGLLRPLLPRLYSIASSLKAHPETAHLTVATVRYVRHGRLRKGVCSSFLAERVPLGSPVPVFVHAAHGFHLPKDGDTPIIMVGPGTGIAPFRAFLQERMATGATGRNWLFFGDQHAREDFLYREELESLQTKGILTRLHTAFSRDQAQKIYVQHRMLENAAEIWRWLEEGAHFYVCGHAARMAHDVETTLRTLIECEGGKTPEQAAEYFNRLEATKRYKRDVY